MEPLTLDAIRFRYTLEQGLVEVSYDFKLPECISQKEMVLERFLPVQDAVESFWKERKHTREPTGTFRNDLMKGGFSYSTEKLTDDRTTLEYTLSRTLGETFARISLQHNGPSTKRFRQEVSRIPGLELTEQARRDQAMIDALEKGEMDKYEKLLGV